MTEPNCQAAEPAPAALQPHTRIQQNAHRGYVRYIGRLDTKGNQVWVGIEWDDPSRGKHSGTVHGRTYFTTATPGSATFLKASKLASGGRTSLLDAVKRRYIVDAADSSYRSEHHVVGGADVSIEAREHARVLAALAVVDVSGLGVAVLGAASLKETLPTMRELRVARSLFDSVQTVRQVLACFPALEVVDVSRNVLRDAEIDEEQEHHNRLKEVIANHCRLSWAGITAICKVAMGVQQVRLRSCPLGAEPSACAAWARVCQGVRLLDLGKTGASWECVLESIAPLPRLEELFLDDNELRDRDLFLDSRQRAEADGRAFFPSLRTLGLGGNLLEGWKVVTALSSIWQLARLRIDGNPVCRREGIELGNSGMTGRMQAIARIGSLQVLNGSSVSEDERRYAERSYINVVCRRDVAERGKDAAEASHPRMKDLSEKYGIVTSGVAKRIGGMRSGMVNVCMRAGKDVPARRRSVVREMPQGVRLEKVARVAKRLLAADGLLAIQAEEGELEKDVDLGREIGFLVGSSSSLSIVIY